MAAKALYRIAFINQGKVYEVYARHVGGSGIMGFVEVSGLEFDARASVVVDPGEEALRQEFARVRRFHVPMHAVIRVDEVEQVGQAKVRDLPEGANVTPFPLVSGRPPHEDRS